MSLLFEISPTEDEDGKKKKKASRKKQEPPQSAAAVGEQNQRESPVGYMLSISGHCQCETCGLTVVDLVEITKRNGEPKWLVKCGWWCMSTWLIDPIPGLLDEADQKQKRSFVLREGRFAGKTFDEIWDSGNEWYVRDLVESARRGVVASAAAEWIAKKGC